MKTNCSKEPILCVDCGKSCKRTSNHQIRCNKCRKKARKKLTYKTQKNWREKNRNKKNAMQIAYRKIEIPKGQICQRCKKRLATERHHED